MKSQWQSGILTHLLRPKLKPEHGRDQSTKKQRRTWTQLKDCSELSPMAKYCCDLMLHSVHWESKGLTQHWQHCFILSLQNSLYGFDIQTLTKMSGYLIFKQNSWRINLNIKVYTFSTNLFLKFFWLETNVVNKTCVLDRNPMELTCTNHRGVSDHHCEGQWKVEYISFSSSIQFQAQRLRYCVGILWIKLYWP